MVDYAFFLALTTVWLSLALKSHIRDCDVRGATLQPLHVRQVKRRRALGDQVCDDAR